MLTWVLDTFNIYCHVILCSAFVRMSDGEFYELCCGFSSFAGLCCGILRFCFLVLFQNDVAAFDHLILLWSLNVFSLSAIPLSDFSFGLDTLESACLCKHLLCVWVSICVWLSLCFSFYCHNVCIFSHMMITSSPVFSGFFFLLPKFHIHTTWIKWLFASVLQKATVSSNETTCTALKYQQTLAGEHNGVFSIS